MNNEIAQIRNQIGVSQEWFAKLVGISRSTLAMAESSHRVLDHKSRIQISRLDRICMGITNSIPDAGSNRNPFIGKQIQTIEILISRNEKSIEELKIKIEKGLFQIEFCKKLRMEFPEEELTQFQPILLAIENAAKSFCTISKQESLHRQEMVLESLRESLLFWKSKLK